MSGTMEELKRKTGAWSTCVIVLMGLVAFGSGGSASALDFAERRGDTLVVVTADHETGGVTAARSLAGGRVTVHYAATTHTGAPVALFAYGPGAERFEGLIDNTDIAKIFGDLLGLQGDLK